MKVLRLFLTLFIALFAFLLVTSTAHAAFDPFENTCDGTVATNDSSVCQDKDKGNNLNGSADGIIPKVANIVAAVGGVIAVVFIMVNGITIMTSTGDSSKISKARDGLIYAAIGLIVIVLARTIIYVIMRYL